MAAEKTAAQLHEEAVSNFMKLGLQYMFSATLVPSGRTSNCVPTPDDHKIRFVFSKPTKTAPEPAVAVYVDAEVVRTNGTSTTYAISVEGQFYKRIITIDSSHVKGNEFNERLIDKVFAQKMRLRQKHLWN